VNAIPHISSTLIKANNYQESQKQKLKFQDQVFSKFQDIFWSQEAPHIENSYFFKVNLLRQNCYNQIQTHVADPLYMTGNKVHQMHKKWWSKTVLFTKLWYQSTFTAVPTEAASNMCSFQWPSLTCLQKHISIRQIQTHNNFTAIIYVTRMWTNAQRDGCPAKYRWRPLFNAAKFGWHPLLECRAVTLPRRKTRWNLQGCPKLPTSCPPLVGRSSPYYEDMSRRYCCLTTFFSDCRYMP